MGVEGDGLGDADEVGLSGGPQRWLEEEGEEEGGGGGGEGERESKEREKTILLSHNKLSQEEALHGELAA